MEPAELASAMRAREMYRDQKLLPGAWIILRVDGRSFSRFTSEHFQKPFDARFHELMVRCARALVEELQGAFVYTQSDEISLVLPPDWALFDRRHEKIVSLAGAIAAAEFSLGVGVRAQFDGRVWLGVDSEEVSRYMQWRQQDATRCALQTLCYWTLRNEGKSAAAATSALRSASVSDKNELLFARGVNFNTLPVWQRRGVVLRWETYMKTGYNPVRDETVEVERRRLGVDEEISMRDAFAAYTRALCDAHTARS